MIYRSFPFDIESAAREMNVAMQAVPVPPERFRPRSIDPTKPLSDKHAHLLRISGALKDWRVGDVTGE